MNYVVTKPLLDK